MKKNRRTEKPRLSNRTLGQQTSIPTMRPVDGKNINFSIINTWLNACDNGCNQALLNVIPLNILILIICCHIFVIYKMTASSLVSQLYNIS